MAANTPEWVRSAVIYEVFPRNHTADGTLAGVYRDLERIADLHTDILWLMPIHPIGVVGRKGALGSPYAVRDYRAIHPDLGDERSFGMLIDAAHALGMKVMMDVVYNHTSCDSVLLSEHPEWFMRNARGDPTGRVADWSDVYDLDYSHKSLWDYQIDTLEKWVDCGVDGFRCDVASLVPLEFWMAARDRLAQRAQAQSQPKELVWLAESVDKSFIRSLRDQGLTAHSDPELHAAFDLTYDYDGFEYLRGFMQGQRPLRDYLNHLYIQETLYPADAVKMRFLENHDNPRAAGIIGSRHSLQNWTAFYSLLLGATLVYAGQEKASLHCPDLFSRDCLRWGCTDTGYASAVGRAGDAGYPGRATGYATADTDAVDFERFVQKVLGLAKTIKKSCRRFAVSEPAQGVAKIVWSGSDVTYFAFANLAGKEGEGEVRGQLLLDEREADQLRRGQVCLGEYAGERLGECPCLRLSDMPLVVRAAGGSGV